MNHINQQDMGNIVILGAGITGLTLAKELSERYRSRVVVVEKNSYVGGLAGTLSKDGLTFDLGSHRLHKNYSPPVLQYIEDALGEELLRRPRLGMFYFFGNYIRYPPNLLSMLQDMKKKDLLQDDMTGIEKSCAQSTHKDGNFESMMVARVGRKAYEAFYRDYATKLWGRPANQISADVGRRGRFLGGFGTVTKAVLDDEIIFLYPKGGIGQISEKLAANVRKNGGRILLGSKATRIEIENRRVVGVAFEDMHGRESSIPASTVVSTIPVDVLYNMLLGKRNPIMLDWRGVRILYLLIAEDMGRVNETYYFPNSDVLPGRVSEIHKYSPHMNQRSKGTLLTIEIPAWSTDDAWSMSESRLVQRCVKDLIRTKVLAEKPTIKNHFSISLDNAYPIYTLGWKERFRKILDTVDGIENLYTLGRKGLFLHCNIDHCIIQGRELAQHLLAGSAANKARWKKKAGKYLKYLPRD